MVSLLLLALGLAMDATAVSLSRGLATTGSLGRGAARCALLFGTFQSGMSALGWGLGQAAAAFVAAWAHWIAFVLLSLIGGKMVYEALRPGDGDEAPITGDPFAWGPLVALAVATSIDAGAAGVTLPLLTPPPWVSLVVIGVVTAALSALAVFLGRRVGERAEGRLDVFGGVVLIGLGIKLLAEGLLG